MKKKIKRLPYRWFWNFTSPVKYGFMASACKEVSIGEFIESIGVGRTAISARNKVIENIRLNKLQNGGKPRYIENL